ncbi:uncharacterized protein LOC130798261 [Amaranthus tricolor]|uniref:uncharacterized protein LOC130798261 n=1 Tax=Amaranthus tricolor TaxID=29722 RepID=UPI00258842F8|nr:uncharacterized protein LOC130798261 [Amaranthus tricolor]
MVSDSIINASIPNASKYFAKKKRANRSAKLKQCKLDARREQWLSQVKSKNCKDEVNASSAIIGCGGGVQFKRLEIEAPEKAMPFCKDFEVKNPTVEISHHDSDLELSPANSPTSSISGGNDSGNVYTGSCSSSFSFSSGGCCSGSITEEEEGEGGGGCDDDECLDDWEAVADALVGVSDDNLVHNQNDGASPEQETDVGLSCVVQHTNLENIDAQVEKSKRDGVGILGRGSENCKAWRPDDAFRPQSLPNLGVHQSFPSSIERHHGFMNPRVHNMTPGVPTSCPICCEELDLTDSSFLPCSCGFHLCLFCHKRIIEEDGRCPGCRQPYASDPLEKETIVSMSGAGGCLTICLARSCSMSSSRI